MNDTDFRLSEVVGIKRLPENRLSYDVEASAYEITLRDVADRNIRTISLVVDDGDVDAHLCFPSKGTVEEVLRRCCVEINEPDALGVLADMTEASFPKLIVFAPARTVFEPIMVRPGSIGASANDAAEGMWVPGGYVEVDRPAFVRASVDQITKFVQQYCQID